MSSKTRDKLIDVAKQLFIRKGVENTTISDIANASYKGRRTIYTYFKNKLEIYKAVIERESDKMVGELKVIVDSDRTPTDKLHDFITLRIAQTKNDSAPYSSVRFLSNIDFGRNEKVRRMANDKEEALLNIIIDQGVASGEFDPQRSELLRKCLYTIVRSIDTINADDADFHAHPDFGSALAQFVISGLRPDRP
ncbi:MAG: TetR/AcrR family transcriptional regulator [Bacteroidales bacterium]|nr:TetR/AcrR family transcriptional regulator [Bacteroidales bacterium]